MESNENNKTLFNNFNRNLEEGTSNNIQTRGKDNNATYGLDDLRSTQDTSVPDDSEGSDGDMRLLNNIAFWSLDVTQLLIDSVGKHYKYLKDANSRNGGCKHNWEAIRKEVAKLNPYLTSKQCAKKWSNLLRNHRQYSRMQPYVKSGTKKMKKPEFYDKIKEIIGEPCTKQSKYELYLEPEISIGIEDDEQEISFDNEQDDELEPIATSFDQVQGGASSKFVLDHADISPGALNDNEEPAKKKRKKITVAQTVHKTLLTILEQNEKMINLQEQANDIQREAVETIKQTACSHQSLIQSCLENQNNLFHNLVNVINKKNVLLEKYLNEKRD